MSRIYALSSVKFVGLKSRLCKIMTNIRYVHIFTNVLFLLSKFVLSSCHLVSLLPPFPTKEKGNKSCWRWRLSPAPIIPTPINLSLILSYSNIFFTAVLETLWLFIPRMTMSKSIWPVYLSSSLWFNHFLEIVVIYFPLKHFKERSALVIFLKLLLLQIDNQSYSLVQFPRYVQYTKALETFHIEPNSHVPQFQPVLVLTGRSWPKFSNRTSGQCCCC